MITYKMGDKDITHYVESATWSGDSGQAARKLEFAIAYSTKDKNFTNMDIAIGQIIYVYSDNSEIFRGVVFFRQRSSDGNTMQFTAYDFLIYLARSKTTRKFSGITVESVLTQVCNELGVVVGDVVPIGVYVDFIADTKSGIEIINEAFHLAYAKKKEQYHAFMREDKLCIVQKGTVVENYTASSLKNVKSTTYSESIEEMVNQILITDENGNSAGYITNGDDVRDYGLLQDVYKIDRKQDTQTQAKALLKRIARSASMSAMGDVRCRTGYSIVVEDDQLKGRFAIKSDRHSFKNNLHTMELELEFETVVSASGAK